MDWYCLKISGDPDPEDAAKALTEFVQREFEIAGSPKAFNVYRDSTNGAAPVFYFSPEASQGIFGLECFEATPCPPPVYLEALTRVV